MTNNRSLIRDLVKTSVAVERLSTNEIPGNFTPGSVLFASATGRITQDAGSFVWDSTNNRLGIRVAAPDAALDISASASAYNSEVGALRISLDSNTAKRLYMGWDTTLDGGYMQSVQNGVNYRPTVINPAGGNVAIGQIAAPGRQFVVNEAANPQIGFNKSTAEKWVIGSEGGASDRFIVYTQGGGGYAAIFNYANGYLGLGNTVAAYRIDLPNTASAAGQGRANAWVTYSSREWKRNIRSVDKRKNKERIAALRACDYDHAEDIGTGSSVGLIAEEVASVYPELVTGDPSKPETLGLMYDRIGAVLLPEVQDHEQRVTDLERKLEAQQRIIDRLLAKLESKKD